MPESYSPQLRATLRVRSIMLFQARHVGSTAFSVRCAAVAAVVFGALAPAGSALAAKAAPFKQIAPVGLDVQPSVEFQSSAYFVGRSLQAGVSLFRVDRAGTVAFVGSLCSRSRADCRVDDHRLTLAGDRLVIYAQRDGGRLWTFDGQGRPTRVSSSALRRHGVPLTVVAAGNRIAVEFAGNQRKRQVALLDPAKKTWTRVADHSASLIGATSGGAVFFVRPVPGGWNQLFRWRVGTAPVPLARTRAESASSLALSFKAVGEDAYFIGYDDEHAEEPWFSDGESDVARMIEDLAPGAASTSVSASRELGGGWLANTSAGTLFARRGQIDSKLPGLPLGTFGGSTLLYAGATAATSTRLQLAALGVPTTAPVYLAVPEVRGHFRVAASVAATDGVYVVTADEGWNLEGPPADSFWKVTGSGVSPTPFFTALRSYCYKGGCDPAFRVLGVSGSSLLFAAPGGIWMSDGTSAGTRRVIRPGMYTRVRPTIDADVTFEPQGRGLEVEAQGTIRSDDADVVGGICRGRVRLAVRRGSRVVQTSRPQRLTPTADGCRFSGHVVSLSGRDVKPHDLRLRAYVQTTGESRVSGATSVAVKVPETPAR